MYKINEYLVYNNNVCKLVDFKEYDGIKYYVLNPIDDESLKIEIPENNDKMRNIITKKELETLIKDIPNIKTIKVSNKELELYYKKLLSSGDLKDLIAIIKTAYLENQDRINNKKHLIDRDTTYLSKAEKRLYNEFMVVLNKSYDDTKKYVEESVGKMING